jgi:hypothetical protein
MVPTLGAGQRPASTLYGLSNIVLNDLSNTLQKPMAEVKVVRCMSDNGDSWDNAPTESSMETSKQELVHPEAYKIQRSGITDVHKSV